MTSETQRLTPAPPPGEYLDSPRFQVGAKLALASTQQRANLRHATNTIRNKRFRVVGEVANWDGLRTAGEQIKTRTGRHLADYLEQFEENFTRPAAPSTGHGTLKRPTRS